MNYSNIFEYSLISALILYCPWLHYDTFWKSIMRWFNKRGSVREEVQEEALETQSIIILRLVQGRDISCIPHPARHNPCNNGASRYQICADISISSIFRNISQMPKYGRCIERCPLCSRRNMVAFGTARSSQPTTEMACRENFVLYNL